MYQIMKKAIIILSLLGAISFSFAQEKVRDNQDTPIKSEASELKSKAAEQEKAISEIGANRSGIWIIEESDIVSALAALVAVFAFYVSYRRCETAKKTLLMSQPVLELFFDELPLQPNDLRFALVLQNKGLSPAIIKDVSYLGQSIKIDGYA